MTTPFRLILLLLSGVAILTISMDLKTGRIYESDSGILIEHATTPILYWFMMMIECVISIFFALVGLGVVDWPEGEDEQ